MLRVHREHRADPARELAALIVVGVLVDELSIGLEHLLDLGVVGREQGDRIGGRRVVIAGALFLVNVEQLVRAGHGNSFQ